ncbi:hypothetical protein BJX70DRAFT_374040 [Aspergillus crustosus]
MATNPAPSRASFTQTHHSTTYPYISPLKQNLHGKHVLITGAAHEDGVGYATALAFARAGASFIALADIHEIPSSLLTKVKNAAIEAGRAAEPLVFGSVVDISSLESVQRLQEVVSREFQGRLDILVNNAAYMGSNKPLLESDPDEYWRTWEVNVRGLFNMARAFLPMLLATRNTGAATGTDGDAGSCIMINVSSSGALTVRPGGGSYRTSKLAVLRWTESLQAEYGDQGLLAFCVNPGAIKTRISEGVLPEGMRDRFPDRAEVAGDTIAWLAGERRGWLQGRYVSCVWDMEELEGLRGSIEGGDLLKMGLMMGGLVA